MDTCFQGQSSATVFRIFAFFYQYVPVLLNINAIVVVERILQDSI